MALPPRPATRPGESYVYSSGDTEPSEAPSTPATTEPLLSAESAPKRWAPAELDAGTRELISDAIARAIAAELGRTQTRISSVVPPPTSEARPSTPPTSEARPSMAAKAAKKTAFATYIGMAVLGASTVAAEWAASKWPHAIGPIGSLLKVALRLIEEGRTP